MAPSSPSPTGRGSGPRVLVVADDLTGAADTGVQFARAGWPTHVWLTHQLSHRDVVGAAVFDADSRSLDAAAAAARVARLARALGPTPDHTLVYKKIDSTLRGNVAAESAALLAALGRRLAVVAPAFPANRRTTRGGVLLADGVPVHRTAAARDPAHPMTHPSIAAALAAGSDLATSSVGLETVRRGPAAVEAALRSAIGAGSPGFAVVDAETDADLAAIAEAVLALGRLALPVGSAGLAAQLAARLSAPTSPLHPTNTSLGAVRPLFVCGSLNPVTLAQVEALSLGLSPIDPFARAAIADATSRLRTGPVLLATGERRFDGAAPAVARRVARAVARLVAAAEPDALVVTGGDVARAVLTALRTDGLELVDELLPGIPVGRAVGGRLEGRPVVTKAGGFGPPDALVRALRYLAGGSP